MYALHAVKQRQKQGLDPYFFLCLFFLKRFLRL